MRSELSSVESALVSIQLSCDYSFETDPARTALALEQALLGPLNAAPREKKPEPPLRRTFTRLPVSQLDSASTCATGRTREALTEPRPTAAAGRRG